MTAIIAWFAQPFVKWAALALLALALIGGGLWLYGSIYNKGQKAGESLVIEGVQTKTIEATEKARVSKEKADDAVRATPYDQNVDSLR